MKTFVITISRQFGSMGRSIAQRLAQLLEVEFYDRDIVEETAKRMGLPVSYISDMEEASTSVYFKRMYPLGMGVHNIQEEIFLIQKNIIRDLAAKESCIIVGRCANTILADRENCLNVYIYAPYTARFENCVTKLQMDEKTAQKMIAAVDRSRALYHKEYGEHTGDMFAHTDIMLDSSRFGIEKTAEILAEIVRQHFL